MKTTNITIEEVVKRLGGTFEALDDTRQEELRTSAEIQEVKSKTLLREKARLAIKYGEDHPRVKKLEARLSYGDSVKKGLEVEIESNNISQPPLEPYSWRVTGLVLDSKMAGIGNLTLSLFDEKNNWLKDLGSVCTDSKGFFSLTVTDRTGELVKQYQKKPLFLTVTKGENGVIYQEKDPMYLEINSIEYRQIILGDEQCPPPPPNPVEGTWIVKGVVMIKANRIPVPMAGAIVRITDREKKFEKMLGEKETNQNGEFEFVFDIKKIKEILKVNPDLFVMVFDKSGKKLYTSPNPIKCKSGGVETLEIIIQ